MARLFSWTIGMLLLASCGSDEPVGELPITFVPREPTEDILPLYLPGLDEHVELRKTRQQGRIDKYVLFEDGTRASWIDVRRAEAAARRVRFGALTPEFATALRRAPDESRHPFVAYFAPAGGHRGEGETHVEWRSRLADQAAAWRGRFQLAGARNVDVGRGMPMITGEASPLVLSSLAGEPEITLIDSARPADPRLLDDPPTRLVQPIGSTVPTWVGPAGIEEFNTNGYYGSDQVVGLIEVAGCALYDWHDGFTGVDIAYDSASANSCILENSSCPRCGGLFSFGGGICRERPVTEELVCVVDHASRVLSAFAQVRDSTAYGATDATIYFPNVGVYDSTEGYDVVACDPDGIEYAYDYLAGKSASISIESFFCGSASSDGYTQDYYARFSGILPFKAGGYHDDPAGTADYQCPYSLESVCVGGMTESGAIWNRSFYANPSGSDREEPDIVERAIDITVIGFPDEDPDKFDTATGTSFAAPTAAALGTLLNDCWGTPFLPREMRAFMIHAGSYDNVHSTLYSTPGTDDYKDGGGLAHGYQLLRYCLEGPPNIDFGTVNVTPSMEPSLPEYIDEYDDYVPTSGRLPIADPGTGRVGSPFWSATLGSGDRVRIVVSWGSCPSAATGTAPAAVAIDFDITLCNTTSETCHGSSHSFLDNNEGFDVTVPSAGTYKAYYALDGSETPCGGVSTEPLFWVVEVM